MNHAPLPKENFADLAADLAITIADCLEHPACPKGLRDALNESVVNELIDLFSANNSALLRALARIHTEAYPGPEKSIPADQGAIYSRPNADSQALASASVSH